MKVYLDYAATSPIKKAVFKTMTPFLGEKFGNPSSLHSWGREARAAVDKSRQIVARFLNCEPGEIIFTSGGTESDNMALRGVIRGITQNSKQILNSKFKILKPHIITTQIEHHAVLNTVKALEKEGVAEATFLKPNRNGIIEVEDIKKAIKKNTVLISVMYVNNEVGTVQPIRDIGKMIERINQLRIKNAELRMKNSKSPNSKFIIDNSTILFHTDAVQATEYQKMDSKFLHVDLLTLSAHKIGGPKGIGAFFIKRGTPFAKCLFGGEQELNLRPGTENVAGMVGLGKAIEELRSKYHEASIKETEKLGNYFIDRVTKEIPLTELNGSREYRSPNNANFYFHGIEGESILLNLDLVGIAASSGSACTSQSLEPSHVLMAIFNHPERAHGSIRFTFGEGTTKEEIDYTIRELKKIVTKLRAMSPLWNESDVITAASELVKEKK